MIVTPTPLEDAFVIEPKVFRDERGYFLETYSQKKWLEVLPRIDWVQDNLSQSTLGTLRGMHLQRGVHAQTKLVRVSLGSVYDVIVDLRPESKSFKHSFGIHLSAENQKQLLVPKGFAHGFLVTSERAIFEYKCDAFYAPQAEIGLHYNCAELNINWPEVAAPLIVSTKDQILPNLETYLQQEKAYT